MDLKIGVQPNYDVMTKDLNTIDKEQINPSRKGEGKIQENDIKKAVDKLNKFLEDDRTHIEFEVHDKFKNDYIIKIVDDSTGKVIQELPPKKLLDMVAKMCEAVGVIFDKKV